MLRMLVLNMPVLGLLLFCACGQQREKIREETMVPAVESSLGTAESRMTNECDTLFEKLNSYDSDYVGMNCGWAGMIMPNVSMMAELAHYGCYGLIDSLMDAPNGSVKYLATLTLDMAIKDSLVRADGVLMERLNASKEDYVAFTICEACTGHETVNKKIGTFIENKKKNGVLTDVRKYIRAGIE